MPTRHEMIKNMHLNHLTASEGLSQPPVYDPNWPSRFTRVELNGWPETLRNYFPTIKPFEGALQAAHDYVYKKPNITRIYPKKITFDEKEADYMKILKEFDKLPKLNQTEQTRNNE